MYSQRKTNTASGTGKGGTVKPAAIVVGIVIIGVLIAVIIFLVLSRKGEPQAPVDDEADRRNVVITQENLDEILAQMSEGEFTDTGYYTVTMNNEWYFPTGKGVSTNAYVENSVENRNDVYFDLFLEEDEENPIYESPVIPLGASLTEIGLDTDLAQGTYPCVLVYHLIDEGQNTLSTLRVGVTVVIEG
jgi:hypothetical protein